MKTSLTGKLLIILLLPLFLFDVHAQEKAPENIDSMLARYARLKGVRAESNAPVQKLSEQKPEKCSFSLISRLRSSASDFSPEQRRLYKNILERPSLPESMLSSSGRFRIHYASSGDDAPRYLPSGSVRENVERVIQAAEYVYNEEVTKMGFLPPLSDGNIGGEGAFDIYIMNLGANSYGYTDTDDMEGTSAYIVIDNDYMNQHSTPLLDGMKVTVAHEFHHAIQLTRYKKNVGDDLFLFESTSTAMEELVFDDINDYYAYLPDYFAEPSRPFRLYSDLEVYSLVIWQLYLIERFGQPVLNDIWNAFMTTDALSAIDQAIRLRNSTFRSELNTFGIWSCYTNYRKQYDANNEYFEEGARYPRLVPTYKYSLSGDDKTFSLSSKPLCNTFLNFNYKTAGEFVDTIFTVVTNGDLSGALNTPNNGFSFDFSIYSHEVSGAKKIANQYYSKLVSSHQDYYKDSYIFNWKTNPGDFYLTELEQAYPMPFRYKSQNVSVIRLPVSYDVSRRASFSIFTPSMQLVYSGESDILVIDDKFTVSWNAEDKSGDRLSSGVYIFVTDAGGKLKKGKLVIINE